MDDALAHDRLNEVLDLIDRLGDLYDRRWGYDGNVGNPAIDSQLNELTDEVRARTKLAHDVIAAMGEKDPLSRSLCLRRV
jgi:hypothetical protein